MGPQVFFKHPRPLPSPPLPSLCLSRYVPWNLHEKERGKFDFSKNLDLRYVAQTALLLNTPVWRGGGVWGLGGDVISSCALIGQWGFVPSPAFWSPGGLISLAPIQYSCFIKQFPSGLVPTFRGDWSIKSGGSAGRQ